VALDFSRNYSPPGVYIEESDTSLVSVTGVPPTLIALVGPARGFQTNTEQFVFVDDPGTRLSKKGIDTDSVVVTVAGTGTAVDPGDFTLDKANDNGGQDYDLDLTAAASPDTDLGTVLFITYQYTDPEYYDPKFFENF
jgi:hypothetical protein